MLEILENKNAFLDIKPKRSICLIIITVILLLIIILLTNIKVYDHYQTKGYVSCSNSCSIESLIPTDIDYDEIYLNKKKLDYELLDSTIEVDQNYLVSYKRIHLKITNNLVEDKEIVELNFYYKKQRIITKLKDLVF